MKYKALMVDVDGTLIPYDYYALPSKRVAEAVKQAQEKVSVTVVTGREFGFIRHILDALEIKKGFAVVNNGANVVDIETETLLYNQPIEKAEADYITTVLFEEKVKFYIKQRFDDRSFINKTFQKGDPLENAYMVLALEELSEKKVDDIFKKLSQLAHISLYKTHHKVPGKYGFNVSHANATKLHGIEIVMKHLGLKKEEVIGVGDSYNDFALLMACGYKVAMGNAINDLKEIADYVAPPVTEDGVADVIEKFILSS